MAILGKGLRTYFAIPLIGEIHEGIRLYGEDNRTLLDKMFEMLIHLNISQAFYFVADKYYCSGRFMKQLISQGTHMVTMMKKSAVAYEVLVGAKQARRGRPKKYGARIKLFSLFKTKLVFISAQMSNDPTVMIEYCVKQFLWRPLGEVVQFILVRHPTKGNSIVMSTDLTLNPLDAILIYSLRFKIEVCFKQAIYQIGTFMYRFWLKAMASIPRGSGEQVLEFTPENFQEKFLQKVATYHLFIQLGFIAQGLMQYLSMQCAQDVWKNFGSWLRTIRENTLPSEKVIAMTLNRTYLEFLMDGAQYGIFKKFLHHKVDIKQLQPSFLKQINTS